MHLGGESGRGAGCGVGPRVFWQSEQASGAIVDARGGEALARIDVQLARTEYYLTSQRNGTRLGNYQRADFRINKNWTKVKWKTALYGEVVNLTNQTNYRYDSFNGYTASTVQARISLDKLFPILPSVGIVVER